MENADSAFIRRTYAHFATTGVSLDGVVDGDEHTRYRSDPVWESQEVPGTTNPKSCLPDVLQERLACVDRYGFFDATAGARVPPRVLPNSAYRKGRGIRRVGDAHFSNTVDLNTAKKARESDTRARVREVKRISKWASMFSSRPLSDTRDTEHSLGVGDSFRLVAPAVKFQRRVYKGIPDRWRAVAWMALASKHGDGPNAISDECDALQLRPSKHDVQIDLDVPRTMRGHVQFHTRYGSGQCGLFAVLHATSLLCQECGYCQGMGPLAAVLLCYLTPTNAYSLLVQLHDDYSFHDFFRPGFPGLREIFYVQQHLTSALLPGLHAVMQVNGIVPSAYATSWYMTLFSSTLPFSTQLRVWEAFLLDGRDVLVCVALAILHAYAPYAGHANAADWLLEALSAPQVPENDDVLMHWVEYAVHNRHVRSIIDEARLDWSAMPDDAQESLFL